MTTGPEDTTAPTSDGTPEGDELREHPQEPAEGPDEQSEERPDVPRVHPEDPAEG
jgi:hypothetical protein